MNIKKPDEAYPDSGKWEITKKKGIFRVSFETPYYSEEDLRSLEQQVLIPNSLHSLIEVLRAFDYKMSYLMGYIKAVSEKRRNYKEIEISKEVTDTSAQYHKQLYDYLFIYPLEELPLRINEKDIDLQPIIKWRLTRGK